MNHQKGFSLIEIIIVLGIFMIIASLGLFISMDFFRGRSIHSEQNTILSILQNARSQSLNNINQVRHGVHFEANPDLKYIIFECKLPPALPCIDYTGADTSKDLIINPNYSSSISSPSLPFDIIFDQLSGDCISSNCTTTPLALTINDGTKNYDIKINNEGRIDW